MDSGYLKDKQDENLLDNNYLYRKAIRCLLYRSIDTRPDISVAVSNLSRKVSNPTQRYCSEKKHARVINCNC